MSAKRNPRPERPTEEELRALLGQEPAAASRSLPGNGQTDSPDHDRALVVSRRDEDISALTGPLGGLAVAVTLARNPFTALDYLRARTYRVVFSDFHLWAGGGALLFERLGQLEHPVDVVFLCERDETALQDARRSGARHVLARPLSPVHLEPLLAELFPRPPRAVNPSPPALAGRTEPGGERELVVTESPSRQSADLDLEEAPGDGTGSAVRSGRGSHREAAAPADVSPWYRFFFDGRRRTRSGSDREVRRATLLELLRATAGAELAVLVVSRESPGGDPEYGAVDIRSVSAGEPAGEAAALGRLETIMGMLRRRSRDGAPLREGGAVESLVLPFPGPRGPRGWLVLVPPAGQSLRPADAAILDELSVLLSDVEKD